MGIPGSCSHENGIPAEAEEEEEEENDLSGGVLFGLKIGESLNELENEDDENDVGDENDNEFRREDGRKTGVEYPPASVVSICSILARRLPYASDDAILFCSDKKS